MRAGARAARIPLVSLVKISWLVTVVVFIVAAALVFVNGYVGYMVVLLAVAASAAVNLR